MVIPRAVYYMNWWTPLFSLFKITFGIHLRSSHQVVSFEDNLGSLHEKPVVCLPNARFCLDTCLKFLNITKGDCVLMTAVNLPDMVTIIENCGAALQFTPFAENSFEPNYDEIIVPKSAKVFFATPLAGVPFNMDKLTQFCFENNLKLILDLTQCFGTKWKEKRLSDYSQFCFSSLCDLKVIHTHRGGYLVSENRELIKFAKERSNTELGDIDKAFFLTSIIEDGISLILLSPFVFRIFSQYLIKILSYSSGDNVEAITSGQGVKFMGFRFFKFFFQSNQVQKEKGFPAFLKYRFTDLQAKIGNKRLSKLYEIERRRISNARNFYEQLNRKAREAIPDKVTDDGSTFWKSPLWIKDPKRFKVKASEVGIDCSQTNLPQLNGVALGSKNNMRDNIVYMPTHWYLKKAQVKHMANFVNKYMEEAL